ncbi:MAG TPA: FHA domain-containing protein [Myxococcales bacterium]|nr:FHA domain-containing protein [Myxococcales bacterium]
MECPRCGAVNETDVGSCLSCGAPMSDVESENQPTMMQKPAPGGGGKGRLAAGAPPKQCPNCMTLNAATFKFCARCGTPLAATGAGAGAAAPPAPAAAAPKAAPAAKPSAKQSPLSASGAAAAIAKTAPPTPKAVAAAPAAKPGTATATRPPTARPAPPPPPKPVTGQVRAPAAAPKPAAPARPRARLSAIARDGSRSADFVLVKDETRVGREVADGEVKLDKDPFIAPLHAVFKFEAGQLLVQDSGSANGVFLWLKERALNSGDELRIGRQRLRVEWMPEEPETIADQPVWGSPNPGYTARVVQLFEGGGEGDVFPLKTGENSVGRGTGDVSFPGDGYVSSKHATIIIGDGTIAVRDLGSANGTFVRINGQAPVTAGDLLLVGEQILRVDPA